MEPKPKSNAKLKTLAEDAQAALYALFTSTDGRKAMSQAEVAAEVERRHGFSVSVDTVSRWQRWYPLHLRLESAKATAEQAKLEFVKENPDASPEDAERLGQYVFTSEMVENGNVKAFVALAKLRLEQRKVAVDERKLALLEAKEEKAKEVLGSDLSVEEQNRRLREILK
jgi:hypothetical protein